MRTLSAVLVLGACTTAPVPTGPVVPDKPVPIVRLPSCEDAGVLLRGSGGHEDSVGKLKEQLITKTCLDDKWDAKVIACIASKPVAAECLGQLTEKQVTSYEEKLATWHETHGYGDLTEDEQEANYEEPAVDDEDWVSCEDAVKHTAVWLPPITVSGDDKTFATGLRDRAMIKLCNLEEWQPVVRACLASASEKTSVACLVELETSQQKSVTAEIAKADKLAAKAIKLAATPAKVGCKQVVAAHYSDAKWKSEVTELKGPQRKKLIDESRKKMTKACTDEKWPAAERACMIGDGGEECFGVAGRSSRWGFPAAGVMMKIGIAECDDYGDMLVKLATCDKLPEATRGALLESFTMAAVYWMKASAADKPAVATSCKAASDAIRQSGEALGCVL